MSGTAAPAGPAPVPGLNGPTIPPLVAAPGTGASPPAAGLINTIGGTIAPSAAPGAPVTGYNPQTSTASNATAVGSTPNAFAVTPNQTVSGQISNIIASGSPLMQQAEANAQEKMNQYGLINSSQAITAGQDALYSAAEPIAAADANTYATAATNTTTAQNQALAAEAAATNTAGLQNAQYDTQNSQYNAGQTNSALAGESSASNSLTQQMAVIQGNQQASIAVQNLADQNKTLLQTSASAASLYQQALSNLASILTNANLDTTQQSQALNDQITQLNDGLQALQGIANNTQVSSVLNFGTGTTAGTGTGGGTGGTYGNGFTQGAANLGLINNGGPG